MPTNLFCLLSALILFVTGATVHGQAVIDAVRNGDLATVKTLIEQDAQLVGARTPRQSTPLHVAISLKNGPISLYLIEKGADLNAVNANSWTPLFYAHQLDLAQLLVDKGADINVGYPNYTALTHFLLYGNKEVAEYLLDRGATLPDSGTPLSVNAMINAMKIGSAQYLDKSMQQGFAPLYESPGNSTLLHYASASQSVELVTRLLDAGVSPNRKNVFGLTALHLAARQGNVDVVKALVQRGANLNDRTTDGRSVWNIAVEANKPELTAFLQFAAADQRPQQFPTLTGEHYGQPSPGRAAGRNAITPKTSLRVAHG